MMAFITITDSFTCFNIFHKVLLFLNTTNMYYLIRDIDKFIYFQSTLQADLAGLLTQNIKLSKNLLMLC